MRLTDQEVIDVVGSEAGEVAVAGSSTELAEQPIRAAVAKAKKKEPETNVDLEGVVAVVVIGVVSLVEDIAEVLLEE